VIAPALMTLAGTLVWVGEFDEGERWLQRTERALQTDTGPDIRLLLHQTTGMLHAGRGCSSAGLLEALPRHQTAHAALLAEILDVLHRSAPAATEELRLPSEELSPGELRVLRYLPTNLSRPEIADELSVSLNTVSTHVRSIYAKLQIRDRSSAVRRARELRLLAAARAR
jgi:ATP/maltotriose-dependent transcriptional regulator MalT